jgi:hypothetical protein
MKESKDFFFEKKKQKTFISLGPGVGAAKAARSGAKVFCFFFSKKKCFLPFSEVL